MDPVETRVVECEPRGKRRRCADAMTRRARALAMTSSTQIRRARCTHAVLTDPIAVMYEMIGGKDVLALKIDVT